MNSAQVALTAENIWPDHFSGPDRSDGVMKCQSSACFLSPPSQSPWKNSPGGWAAAASLIIQVYLVNDVEFAR